LANTADRRRSAVAGGRGMITAVSLRLLYLVFLQVRGLS
jgi:hypothetical protein